jgi:2-(1,2-epoxy-1,2-dihydrophenyl)acetyl-CoA isomerase
MDLETLRVDRDGDGVVSVVLDRPERRNALSLTMFRELREVLEEVGRRPADRVLVLRGAGGTFCSGGDLTPEAGERLPEFDGPGSIAASALVSIRNDVGRTAQALHSLEKPSIAAVEGTAAGAGACLALGCDLTFAARGARFGLVFVSRGLALDFGGSWLLPRLVGLKKAKELALGGEWLDADAAERLGLINRVFAANDFEAGVAERASHLARQAPLALSIIKRSLDRAPELSFAEALEAEAIAQAALTSTNDFSEGMKAFLEKRPPGFRGT